MNSYLPFRVEYAKSGRAACRHCHRLIPKDELRLGKYLPSPYHDGMICHWYHTLCLFDTHKNPKSISSIANFDNIRWGDQEFIQKKIGGRRKSEPGKRKSRGRNDTASYQTAQLANYELTYKRLTPNDLANYKIEYVEFDDVECTGCEELFKVGELQLSLRDSTTGTFDEWHHLDCFSDLREDYKFFESGNLLPGFSKLKNEDQDLVLKKLPVVQDENIPPSFKKQKLQVVQYEEITDQNQIMKNQNGEIFKMRDQLKALSKNEWIELLNFNDQIISRSPEDVLDALADRMVFGAVSKCSKCSSSKMKFISGYGYKCLGNLTTWTKCDNVTKDPMRLNFIIPPHFKEKYEFLRYYIPSIGKRLMRITSSSSTISSLSLTPDYSYYASMDEENVDLDTFEHTNSLYAKGNIIDPKEKFAGIADVYQRGDIKYSTTLGLTSVQTGHNSFYKLLIMKYIGQEKYCLFRSWGRIGTSNGGSKLDSWPIEQCISEFERFYFEKSGNLWENKNNFVKRPSKMYPIDTQDDVDNNETVKLNSEVESTLNKPVQELMKLIFNINTMKNLMRDFKIDVDKMPLGKISRKQLEQAYLILRDLQQIISGGFINRLALVDATSRFYTLVPHSFGMATPPILDNEMIINEKCQMLEALIEMEIAYNLINSENGKNKNALDAHYEQLNTQIDILDHNSDEFKLIQRYAKHTHAVTHSDYSLEIVEVFKVKRQGETERYNRFESLHNKKLLWHGSRTTNFAGILSQGLRIAPPEAPVSGYMFGKGIYFADMVSKSANYCFANHQNSTGLLLLCEVALGNMIECYHAQPNIRLPPGVHSVFGRGKTFPDPMQIVSLPNNVVVPCGIPTFHSETSDLQLLYNEYIVYNPAQVKVQYLVRMKFHFNH